MPVVQVLLADSTKAWEWQPHCVCLCPLLCRFLSVDGKEPGQPNPDSALSSPLRHVAFTICERVWLARYPTHSIWQKGKQLQLCESMGSSYEAGLGAEASQRCTVSPTGHGVAGTLPVRPGLQQAEKSTEPQLGTARAMMEMPGQVFSTRSWSMVLEEVAWVDTPQGQLQDGDSWRTIGPASRNGE